MSDIRDNIASYMERHHVGHELGGPHLVSWMQIIIIGVAYIASLGVFYGTMQAGYNALHGAVDEMKNEIHDQTIALNRLAGANERLDEHMKAVDRRLDTLEKDRPIESYRRN